FTPTSPSDPYTLSLHDALPICSPEIQATRQFTVLKPLEPHISFAVIEHRLENPDLIQRRKLWKLGPLCLDFLKHAAWEKTHVLPDRKSTRLNSSHLVISYAVFC